MTLDGRILRGLFEHERLKPTNIRTSKGNVQNSIKTDYECRTLVSLKSKGQLTYHLKTTNINCKF